MVKAKKKKKVAARKVAEKGNGKPKGVKGLNGLGVCQNWLMAFKNKSIKTEKACTAFMLKQYPGRESKILHFPNVVISRANRGLLTGGKIPKPLFQKYPAS